MPEPADQELLRSIFLMEAWDTLVALEQGVGTLCLEPVSIEAGEGLFVVQTPAKGAASLHGFPGVARCGRSVVSREPARGSRRSARRRDPHRRLSGSPQDGLTPSPAPAATAREQPWWHQRKRNGGHLRRHVNNPDPPVRISNLLRRQFGRPLLLRAGGLGALDGMAAALLRCRRRRRRRHRQLFRAVHTLKAPHTGGLPARGRGGAPDRDLCGSPRRRLMMTAP